MRHIALFLAGALLALAGGAARAEDRTPSLTETLAGNTVSAVMFLPHEDQVDRVVFQAYLRPDGSALVRRWDAGRDAYTNAAETRWTVSGTTLCLAFPGLAGGSDICIETHVWGPRIAGNTAGTGRFAMLDGDIEPGNSIAAQR